MKRTSNAVDHHRGEYAYRDRESGITVTTNSAEGFYSVFKRGMRGVYQHCDEKHLHRYLAEFDFRHSNREKLGSTMLPVPTVRCSASKASG